MTQPDHEDVAKGDPKDKFVDMVSARADVDLRLSDFKPRSSLRVPCHTVERPRFPVIDYHNHLDSRNSGKIWASVFGMARARCCGSMTNGSRPSSQRLRNSN